MSVDPPVTRAIDIVKRLVASIDESEEDVNDEEEYAYNMFHMVADRSLIPPSFSIVVITCLPAIKEDDVHEKDVNFIIWSWHCSPAC